MPAGCLLPWTGVTLSSILRTVIKGPGSRGNWSAYGKGVAYEEFLIYEDCLIDPHRRLILDAPEET